MSQSLRCFAFCFSKFKPLEIQRAAGRQTAQCPGCQLQAQAPVQQESTDKKKERHPWKWTKLHGLTQQGQNSFLKRKLPWLLIRCRFHPSQHSLAEGVPHQALLSLPILQQGLCLLILRFLQKLVNFLSFRKACSLLESGLLGKMTSILYTVGLQYLQIQDLQI